MNRSNRAKATILAALTPVALILVSCSNASDSVPEPTAQNQPAPETVTETVAEHAPETPADGATAAAPGAGNREAQPADCASLPNDPRTQYPTGSAPGRMPNVDGSDYNFWIGDIENHYDPCAPLSYIIFHGSLGDERGRSGMAGSITDGIAFYVNGVPDGEMRTFSRIESVELIEPGRVRLAWGEPGQGTAMGITDHFAVDVVAKGDHIEATPEGDFKVFEERWNTDYGEYLLGTYD